jgi:hypothetical protein
MRYLVISGGAIYFGGPGNCTQALISPERPERANIPLVLQFSGVAGGIIWDRIAGVAPEQHTDVGRRALLDILTNRLDVPLEGPLRLQVASELERVWIPKDERERIYEQRELDVVEDWRPAFKHWAKVGGRRAFVESCAEFFGFSSGKMLDQFRLRVRQGKPAGRLWIRKDKEFLQRLPRWILLRRRRPPRS